MLSSFLLFFLYFLVFFSSSVSLFSYLFILFVIFIFFLFSFFSFYGSLRVLLSFPPLRSSYLIPSDMVLQDYFLSFPLFSVSLFFSSCLLFFSLLLFLFPLLSSVFSRPLSLLSPFFPLSVSFLSFIHTVPPSLLTLSLLPPLPFSRSLTLPDS